MKLTVVIEKSNRLYKIEDFKDFSQFNDIEFILNDNEEINDIATRKIDINTTHLLLDDVIVIEKTHLDKLKHLKYIGTTYSGWWDKYFDVQEIKNRNIKLVINTNYATNAVAEATFSAFIMNARNGIHGDFESNNFELKDKKLLIVGQGKIGKRIKEISDGFKIKTSFYDSRLDKIEEFDSNYDLLSINIPKNAGQIIDGTFLSKQNSLRLIANTSGWENVNTEDLAEYLEENRNCTYLHLAFPDKKNELKFSGLNNTVFYPLFSNKTMESKCERKEAPLRELKLFISE